MKKLFLLITILISIRASSQHWTEINNYQNIRGVWADSVLKLPTDTTINKSAGSIAYKNGTLYRADGTHWAALTGAGSSGVISFNGRTGVVVPATGDYNLNMLGDVSITSLHNGQYLVYDSATNSWENTTFLNALTLQGAFDNSIAAGETNPMIDAGTNSFYLRGQDNNHRIISVSSTTGHTMGMIVNGALDRAGFVAGSNSFYVYPGYYHTDLPSGLNYVLTDTSGMGDLVMKLQSGGGSGGNYNIPYNGDSSYYLGGDSALHQLPYDSTALSFPDYLDSTGNPQQRVLYADGLGHIRSSPRFLWDSANKKLVIGFLNVSQYGSSYKLVLSGNARFSGYLTAAGFKTPSGTSTEFLKADGTVDNNSYLTTETDPIALKISNNLSDVTSASTARTNLGLGSFSILNNPATTNKDFIYYDGSVFQRLAKGNNGQHLIIDGSGNYAWVDSSAGSSFDTSIAYTWTGMPHTWSYPNVGTTVATPKAILLINPTPATSTQDQYSPGLSFNAQGWNGSSSAGAQSYEYFSNTGATPVLHWRINTNEMTFNGGGSGTLSANRFQGSVIGNLYGNIGTNLSGTNITTFINADGNFNGSVQDRTAVSLGPTNNNTISANNFVGVLVKNTYNQSGTTANYDLLIDRKETSLGSGAQWLINAGTNSSTAGNVSFHTTLFGVDNKGIIYASQSVSSPPSPAIGYFAIWMDSSTGDVKITKNVSGTTTTTTIF